MGSCCSRIDNSNDISSFSGPVQPTLEPWQAAQSSCHFCNAHWVAGHLQCCACATCQRAASRGVKGFANVTSYSCEPMCSLCMADVYDPQLHHQASCASSRSSSRISEEDASAPHYGFRHGHHSKELTLAKIDLLGKHSVMQGNLLHGQEQEISKESRTLDHFLRMDQNCDLLEHKNGMHFSGTPSSCTEEDHNAPLGHDAASEMMAHSRRLSNIDDSDGIKLEVRYKHMLPHDGHIITCSYTSPHDVNVLKRARPQEDPLLAGDPEANRSIRRCKSFQISGFDDKEGSFERLQFLQMIDCKDEFDNDDNFHDITVGVSIGSCDTGRIWHPDANFHDGSDSFSLSHGNISIRDLLAQEGLKCNPDHIEFARLDRKEVDRPLYVMSEENLQFITRKEREWEEKAHCTGIVKDKLSNKMQGLSVVSTGDAILFSGANSDEFHLIPSVTIQTQKSSLSSPKHNLIQRRIVSPERPVTEKLPFSIEDIIHLLENEELGEDDVFSLLMDSYTKSSASSPPSSSDESTNSWSSPLSLSSSSSSSSSSSTSTSTSSSCSSSMPSSSPLPSTLMLQLPPSFATYSSTLPYPLSIPACKMSPHTSFEFTVKSCGSTPSTPVFSPIQSRTKRSISCLKPSALTTEEIAEIWGVYEQRQAFMSQQHTQ